MTGNSGNVNTSASALSASALGSVGGDWAFLGQVVLAAGSSSLTVSYIGNGTPATDICLLQPMSSTVYDSQEDVLSQTDAMGNVTASSYDALGRPLATSQGQTIATSGNSATFDNLPQSPGLTRTYTVYVYSPSSAPSGTFTIKENTTTISSLSGPGSSTTPLGSSGSGWYDLGSVTLLATDVSSTLTINCPAGVSQVAFLEQTSATVYDAMGNVLSQTDGLGNVTTYAYNNLEQQVSNSRGQILPVASQAATFANLPQTPGAGRTFTVYVQSSSTLTSGSCTVGDNNTVTPTFTGNFSANTPLGNNWYELGTITLDVGDASSTMNFSALPSAAAQICLVQQVSAATYTADGLVASATNADGGVTSFGYDAVGDQVSQADPAPDPNAPAVRPVTSTVYDALGRVTATMSPLASEAGQGEGSAITAYGYQFGTTAAPGLTATTWQGAALAPDSSSTSSSQTWTFSNLTPNSAGTYAVFVQAASTAGYTASDAYTEGAPLPLERQLRAEPFRRGPGRRLAVAGHRGRGRPRYEHDDYRLPQRQRVDRECLPHAVGRRRHTRLRRQPHERDRCPGQYHDLSV